jgi:hypothetical protein
MVSKRRYFMPPSAPNFDWLPAPMPAPPLRCFPAAFPAGIQSFSYQDLANYRWRRSASGSAAPFFACNRCNHRNRNYFNSLAVTSSCNPCNQEIRGDHGVQDVRSLTETRASLTLWWISRQEVLMTQSAVSFMLGVVAPVALVSWLILLY